MAIAYVQTAGNAGDSVTITGVTAGNLLVWCGASGSPVTALSDSSGSTWVKVPNDQDQSGILLSTSMWYCLSASAGGHTVTRTGGFNTFEYYRITEYSAGGAWSLDAYTSANATAGDPDSGLTSTTTQADELLVGCIGNNATQDNSAGWQNSFVSRGYGVGTSRALDVADLIVSATGQYRAKATSAGPQNWQALIATFSAAAGGPSFSPAWAAFSNRFIGPGVF